MRLVSRLVFICALAAAAMPCHAETLHGRVVDRASLESSSAGKGLAGAKLLLYDAGGHTLAAKSSGKTGGYAFPRLAPGVYTVAISRKGWLPKRLLRVIEVNAEDTLSRDFLLDRLPLRGGLPALTEAPAPAKRKAKPKTVAPYYPQLAEGMLAALRMPAFHRDLAHGEITLGRFFDAEDTTLAYRDLWAGLLWAEIESQDRPVESMVYLAHAYDSALKAESFASPAALKPWLKADADSTQALTLTARAMLLKPGKKDLPTDLAKKSVPKSITLKILEAQFAMAAPKPKKKAFLAKIKGLIGPEYARKFALLIDPPRKQKTAKTAAPAPTGPPRADMEAIWKVVTDAAAAREANPVALYHLAMRKAELGKAREAVTDLQRLAPLRPDEARSVAALADLKLGLGDTSAAAGLYDSLSRVEAPEWQAKGFRAAARLDWAHARGETAERGLWRAIGLDSRSPAARADLLLLAEITLTRDSWTPVEALLDSLIKQRPREADAYFWLGRMALKRQQDGVALERFQRAAALAPQRPEFATAVAGAHFAREECDAALKVLKPVRSRLGGEGLSIYGQCLLRQGRSQEAVAEFEKLYAARPNPANLSAWARALTAAKQPRKAVAAIQASPHAGDFEARKALAEADIALGDAAGARQLLDPAPAGRETDPELHYLLGQAAFALREYPEAGTQLTGALQYREDYPDAKYLQGLCLLKQGRSGEAHHYFQELMDSEKPSWRAKGLLGQGQAFAKEEKPEAAEENLRRSFQAAPGAEAAAHLALTLLKLGKLSEAAEWAAKARKLDPDEPLGLMASVDGLLADHREAEALALAQAGLEAHPDGCDFMVVAAKAQLRAGHDGEAAELSRRASGRCPEESAPYYYLGTLSARAGTVKEARRLFAEYLRTGGDAKRVPVAYR